MSETRNLRHPASGDVQQWRADFDELELRMDALRQAFTEGVRSFTMTDEIVERIHARFDDVGEQVHKMHCTYPFGGWPGQEDCRFEPPVRTTATRGRARADPCDRSTHGSAPRCAARSASSAAAASPATASRQDLPGEVGRCLESGASAVVVDLDPWGPVDDAG